MTLLVPAHDKVTADAYVPVSKSSSWRKTVIHR